jgi:diguanylate cyclase (GGDEF)-like protein
MGMVLGISIFVALWLSLWAATILANLYQRLANQKMEIEHQSRHDPLTSLPNRHTIGEIIEESIDTNDNELENVLLCLVDVNGLKDVNDSLGHEYGDDLLRNVSERLKDALRSSDRVGRFGGDKFAVVLKHSKNTAIEELCTRLLSTFDRAFQIKGHSLYLGATLGIASFPEHAEDAQRLIQKSEIALHTAKDASKDFIIFDANKDRRNPERLNLANDLRHAIREGQLSLYYQPQLDLRTGKIIGVEALARWNHPEHGFIPPDTFVAIAERTGLIKQLTEFVFTTAIKQCAEWRRTMQSLAISINLSARNLHDETLPKQMARLIRHWKIIPEQICLEITETAMMADPEHARELLEELDRLGVRISIDDFGTGYSSLTYLKKLPVNEIKIDKSFVMNMSNSENDASIIRATVSLAHDLGLTVVAEGVENQASQDALKQMGCEIAQGYHICKPAPAEEITKLLSQPATKKTKRKSGSPSPEYDSDPYFKPI